MADQSEQSQAPTTELGLRAVLDLLGAYIYTKDKLGRYTFANRAVCELFGVPLEQIVGKDDSHFFDLERSNELRRNDRRALDQGETTEAEEQNIVKPSGETRIYWTIKAPVLDGHAVIIGMCGISTDITERKRLVGELEAQRQLLDTVLNNVGAFVYMKGRDGRYLYVNQQTAELIGRPAGEAIGRNDQELYPIEFARQLQELDRKVFETGTKQSAEETIAGVTGAVRHYWSTKMLLKRQGHQDALIGFSTDITELHLLKEELRRLAMTDALTGVSNRRHFFEKAHEEFLRVRRYPQALSLMMLDIDFFKKVNDTFGHQAGDKVICAIAEQCQTSIRGCDLVGRLGGEEFAIVLPATSREGTVIVANRLCASVRARRLTGEWEGEIAPTVSIGVATLSDADDDIDALVARADKALYRAKETGRDKVCVAT